MGNKQFPDGIKPLGKATFSFACHTGVSCYTCCCRKVDLTLYPYDILQLRKALALTSGEILQRYVRLIRPQNSYFPRVMLRCTEESESCPFLGDKGCLVYSYRPSACRTYPLERAIDRAPEAGKEREFYFLTHHKYCMGHNEECEMTVEQWLRSQGLYSYNLMNDLYGELDTIFAANPWKGEEDGSELQKVAFMVCYDIDGFKEFVEHNKILDNLRMKSRRRRLIKENDEELLKFGMEWMKEILVKKIGY